MPLSSSASVHQTPQEDRNKRNPKTNVCEHIFVFIFTSSFLNCCNQAAIWYNCTVIANYWIMELCVCVCVRVGKGHTGVYNLFCFLPPSSPSETGREVCKLETIWTSDGAVSLSAVCVCVWEAAAALASDSTCFHQKKKATQSPHCTYSPNPSLLLSEVKTGRGVHVWNSSQIFTDLWLCLFNTYKDLPWF